MGSAYHVLQTLILGPGTGRESANVNSPSGYEWWEAWLWLFLLLLLGAAAALGGAAALLSVPALLDGVGERQTLAGA